MNKLMQRRTSHDTSALKLGINFQIATPASLCRASSCSAIPAEKDAVDDRFEETSAIQALYLDTILARPVTTLKGVNSTRALSKVAQTETSLRDMEGGQGCCKKQLANLGIL